MWPMQRGEYWHCGGPWLHRETRGRSLRKVIHGADLAGFGLVYRIHLPAPTAADMCVEVACPTAGTHYDFFLL